MDTTGGLKAELAKAWRVMAWCLRSESAPRINAMLDLARSEPGVPILPEHLDADPWLLNCPKGTLDLRTGALREHRREDYITKLCPTEYDAGADCPVFRRFLDDVFEGDGELAGFVRRLLGRCASGDVSEQQLPVFWGAGANGKTTLLNAVLDVLGRDYAMKAGTDLLLQRRGERHPTELADLFGMRLVVASETDQGRRLNEALVKDLTGGERVRARRMKENFWEFSPTHKIVLQTNHKPVIRGRDNGIWRRVLLVPFAVRFWAPGEAPPAGAGPPGMHVQDKDLAAKLHAERRGILRWLVEG